ncbi:MAG: tyrosine recombinase XerC [Bacteroidia bacterium]
MHREPFFTYLQIERNYSVHTLRAYETDLRDLAAWLTAHFACDLWETEGAACVTHRHLRSWMAQLMEQGCTARTVARKLSSARSYFRYLRRAHLLPANPAARLRLPRFEQKLPVFLQESETEELLRLDVFGDTFEEQRDRCMLELLYGCGLRRSELIGLRLADVNRYARTLRVRGKGNKERILPYGRHAADAIDTYLEAARRDNIALDAAFFVRPNAQPLYPKLVYETVGRHLARVSTRSRRSPHVLRHTFATHMLDRGADLDAIKELLGHSSLAATQVYTHNTISKLKAVHDQAHPRAGTYKDQ